MRLPATKGSKAAAATASAGGSKGSKAAAPAPSSQPRGGKARAASRYFVADQDAEADEAFGAASGSEPEQAAEDPAPRRSARSRTLSDLDKSGGVLALAPAAASTSAASGRSSARSNGTSRAGGASAASLSQESVGVAERTRPPRARGK
jgi:hypothetical protein